MARRSGYVVTTGEIMPGTWGLAVPVSGGAGTCELSIGVIAAQALDEAKTSDLVRTACRELSGRLGHDRA